MSRRLGRRSAGDRVLARAHRLSDDLLSEEETCFRLIGHEYDSRLIAGVRTFQQAWISTPDPALVAADRVMVGKIQTLQRDAAQAARDHVTVLAGKARDMALAAIGDELAVCEETLAVRYRGVAEAAVMVAKETVDDLLIARMVAFTDTSQWSVGQFAAILDEQLNLGSLYREEEKQVQDRVFSARPVNLKGRSGRGVWWSATSDLNRAARDVSIRLSSQVRMAAMAGFNEVGGKRA